MENRNRLNRRIKIGPLKIAEKISNFINKIDTDKRKTLSNFYHMKKIK